MTLGRLHQVDDRWQLRFTRSLPHPPQKVWRALTEPKQLRGWFPAVIEGERAAGAKLRFVFPNSEGPTIDGEMVAYEPPSLLEYRWGDETLRFELQPDGDGTVLTFVNTFDELGKAARDGAGWHARLDLLERGLADEEAPWTAGQRWEQLHAAYMERFGPDASTIGPPQQRTGPTTP